MRIEAEIAPPLVVAVREIIPITNGVSTLAKATF